MKLFRIFAVGLIISAVVVATAIAPITNAVGGTTPPPSFSDNLFVLPNIDMSSFTSAVLNYTPLATTTTGPPSDPPKADVVPNFSGLVVNGPTAIDGDDDGTEDLIIDEDGEIFINNKFKVDANDDGDKELEINSAFITLGNFPGDEYMAIVPILNMIQMQAGDSTNIGFFSVRSPQVHFESTNTDDVDFQIDGDLTVTGLVKSGEAIGSYYRRYYYKSTNVTYSSVPCFTGDFLTGCSARTTDGTAIEGTRSTTTTCYGYNVGSRKIKLYANCFDPNGAKSGLYTYDPANPND